MMLQALLVSKDDQAAETLTRVLAQFGVAVERSSAVEVAVARISEEHFDQAIVDFDDPATASLVLETIRREADAQHAHPAVTVALLPDSSQIRSILGAGAHFILTKPVAYDQASATLRAVTALLKHERRQSFRIPVQAPVSLRTNELPTLEGIVLDVSAGGMDILAAQPLASAALVHFAVELPPGTQVEGDAEVAWSSANGQSGLRFLDVPNDMRERLAEWLTGHSQQALPEEPDPVTPCKLTDLSVGGCYVETESPFPQGSAVDLCLRAAGMEIHTEAVVRVMHPEHGMGIEFPARTEDQRKSVSDFIDFLTSQPAATPELGISPRSLVASREELNRQAANGSELDDPLLELLRTGAALEQPEFLSELHRQRTSTQVS
jgi:DNA-binding response OmpR family regulator